MSKSQPLYLLLGTNLGNRFKNLNEAIDLLEKNLESKAMVSSIYETAAWGKTDQPGFLNQVVCLQSSKSAPNILKLINKIEADLGRERFEKWGPRLIDIDILIYGTDIYDTKELTVPHAELQNRKFALVPLNEIASAVMHPILKITVNELLNQCSDSLEVIKL